ncbi:hypothetical protein [Actinoplanes sp. TFC3]|uniref:hypothetical protein n=1 Tax=Actinoplanes sp. TFC3 TaxID=1710355 RepID=UPI001379C925|nr:hypothetical protein [Actinoplanes sp. TFC3]
MSAEVVRCSLDELVVGDPRLSLIMGQADVLDGGVIGDSGPGDADALEAVVTPKVCVADHAIRITGENKLKAAVPAVGACIVEWTWDRVVCGAV